MIEQIWLVYCNANKVSTPIRAYTTEEEAEKDCAYWNESATDTRTYFTNKVPLQEKF
jgi:hypothetical protein